MLEQIAHPFNINHLSEIKELNGTSLIGLESGVPNFNESGHTLTRLMREGTKNIFFDQGENPRKFQEILTHYPNFIARVEAIASGFFLKLNDQQFSKYIKVLAEISKRVIDSYKITFTDDENPDEQAYIAHHQNLQNEVSNFALDKQMDLLKALHPLENAQQITDRIEKLKHITLADIYASVALVLGLNTEIDDQVIRIINGQIDEQTRYVPEMTPVLQKLINDSSAKERALVKDALIDLVAVSQSIHLAWDSFQGFRNIHRTIDPQRRDFINRDVYAQFPAIQMEKFEQGFRKVIPIDNDFHNLSRVIKEEAQETGMAFAIIEVLKDIYFLIK